MQNSFMCMLVKESHLICATVVSICNFDTEVQNDRKIEIHSVHKTVQTTGTSLAGIHLTRSPFFRDMVSVSEVLRQLSRNFGHRSPDGVEPYL